MLRLKKGGQRGSEGQRDKEDGGNLQDGGAIRKDRIRGFSRGPGAPGDSRN
jgi:hypothetical protein